MQSTTLDSIRPSDIDDTSGERSYLHGRDPSILAYGQRRICSLESKKNLISLYEEEDLETPEGSSTALSMESLQFQTVKVYLRMKPFPRKMQLTKDEEKAYEITNSTTLFTKLPTLDYNVTSLKRSKRPETVCRKFTFTQTFGPETTQLELFEQAIKTKVIDFLAGHNSTVMTYGTTNSGKSYTLQGTTTSPGIIPRGLEFIFANINPRSSPCYKPTYHCSVISLNAIERAQEIEVKNKLLSFASLDKNHHVNTYSQMQKLLEEESPLRASQACDAHYSVWVSFAEIYNETIYDLLSNDCQKRRPPLKLGTDSHGRTFIKGLKMVCVHSGSEAYQVLMAGQYNLKIAATALNPRSSRSHCIFTIKLLKYYIENAPQSVEVSTFAFCDLAGSERLKKTLNDGDRLKEAQNINTSLLVLGRCLKSIYEGQSQKQKHEHIGPFRESKLTRLFQRALSGKEQIALIVNVNPVPNLYIETQNVLNFSAIAKNIVIEPKKLKPRISNSRFSQLVTKTIKSNTDWDNTELDEIVKVSVNTVNTEEDCTDLVEDDEYEDLLHENQKLKKQLTDLKGSLLSRDLQIRKELADTYMAMMNKMENDWKNRIRDVEAQQEDNLEWRLNTVTNYYEGKITQMKSRKKRRRSSFDDSTENDDSDDETKNIIQLEKENSQLTHKMNDLKKVVKELRAFNDATSTEKNKLAFELSLVKQELKTVKGLLASAQNDLCNDEESMNYINDLRAQLDSKQERIKSLKEFLNEAKQEYIDITTDARKMEHRLKVQNETLIENQERIADLEEFLDQANICLANKTKEVEALEEKCTQQTTLLVDTEEKLNVVQQKLIESERNNFVLTNKIAALEKSISPEKEEIIDVILSSTTIKEELFSESSDVGSDNQKVMSSDGSPENIESTGINNEVFVEVREITVDIPVEHESLNELKAKLRDSEAENTELKRKLSDSLSEIKLLKDDFNGTKDRLNDVMKQVSEFKVTQKAEDKTKSQILADTKSEQESGKIQDETSVDKVEQAENSCQTDAVLKQDQTNQTNFTEIIRDEKSVQTIVNGDEASTERENLLEELKMEHAKLETEYKEKEAALAKATEDLNCQLLECRNAYEIKLSSLENEVREGKEEDGVKTQIIKDNTSKIAELEEALASRTKQLEDDVKKLNSVMEQCENDKKVLEQRLIDNSQTIVTLENRISQSQKRDQEKDDEIRHLQKDLKRYLVSTNRDENMERDLKRALKELMDTKDVLERTDDCYLRYKESTKKQIEQLEMQVSVYEKNAKALELVQETAKQTKAEIQRLQTENEELKNTIAAKDREMQSFIKNRDETIAKYESWVKSQQSEIDRSKREITRFQELFHRQMPTTPREKEEMQKNSIPIVELSGSETKRNPKETLPPPSSGKKRATRRKRLYQPADDSYIDIEPCEPLPPAPSPPASTRSLRTRRK